MSVTNTSKDQFHPELLFGKNSKAIQKQEAQGQSELVNSTLLPVRCDSGKETLEAAGVVFGAPLADDPLFCEAVLPDGWKKVPTDHSMWSDLVDENGVKRAAIFYKAASYDRNALMYAV